MDFSGLNSAVWVLLVVYLIGVVWSPFRIGKARDPYDGFDALDALIGLVLALFALRVLFALTHTALDALVVFALVVLAAPFVARDGTFAALTDYWQWVTGDDDDASE